jgi:hypothetical protein
MRIAEGPDDAEKAPEELCLDEETSCHVSYAYLVGSAGAMLIWLTFWFYAGTTRRSLMLQVCTVAGLWGLAEPLFVPEYWSPPSLFNLNHLTGFDIESVVFQFATGGIATAIYVALRETRPTRVGERPRSPLFHRFALVVAPVLFFALAATTKVNPIYIAIVALFAGAAATCLCRPDLIKNLFVSGLLFLGLYLAYFLTFNAIYADYITQVWNLNAISGRMIARVPLEELLYGFFYGVMLSSVAEHFAWMTENRALASVREVSLDGDRLNNVDAGGPNRGWDRAQ